MSAPSFTYSGNVYTAGIAGTVDFPLTSTTGNPIPYLEPSHIHVYKSADSGVTWTELTRPAQWDFITSGTVARLAVGIVTGEWVKVQRITPSSSAYVTFQPSSLLTAEQLNDDTLFNTYLNQDQQDRVADGVANADAALIAATAAVADVAALSAQALRKDGSVAMQAPFNLGGYKAINAIAPTADTDLATKAYVDTRAGAPGPPGLTLWTYTASGGEQVLGSIGANGSYLEYQAGKEMLFLNGALLLRGDDYTAEDGLTVTLALALAPQDRVVVRCINYLPANPSLSYSYTRWRKVAAGGEISVGPAGDLSTSGYTATLAYATNREQVFLNGAMLLRGDDYSAATGSTIAGLAPLSAGDVVEVHAINSL
jgi:hypothetical protein